MEILSYYTPAPHLITLVRKVATNAKTVSQWNTAINSIENFAKLSEKDIAWLAGVRFMGTYIRPDQS